MQQIILLCLGLLFSQSSFAASKKCEAPLGARPDRKTLGVGALLQLKQNLKTTGFGSGVFPVQVQTGELHLHKSLELGRGGWRILPGMQLRTLSAYQKVDGIAFVELEVPGTEMKGFMYWTDLYRNAVVLEEGLPVVKKTRSAVAKFAEKCRPSETWDELKRQGLTAYGRPFGSVGQLVWIQNHSRSMSPKTVGWVRHLDDNGRYPMVVVETLSGETREVLHDQCSLLTDAEAAEWTAR